MSGLSPDELRKKKDEAAKAFTSKKWPHAVELLDEICRADPKDLGSLVKLGDALVKMGLKSNAIRAYERAAQTYAAQGFLPKAIAICKVLLEVDPQHKSTQQILAGLYAKRLGTDSPPASPRPLSRPVPPAHPPAHPTSPAGLSAVQPRVAPRSQVIIPPPPPPRPPTPAPIALDEPEEISGITEAVEEAEVVEEASVEEAAIEEISDESLITEEPAPLDLGQPLPPDEPLRLPVELSPQARQRLLGEPGVDLQLEDPEPEPQLQEPTSSLSRLITAPPSVPAAAPPAPKPLLVAPAAAPAQAPQTAATPKVARPNTSDRWGSDAFADSIENQLESAMAQQVQATGPLPLQAAPPAVPSEEPSSVEVSFDVPMADEEEEEIEVMSVTADLPKNLGRELPKIPLFSDLAPEAFVELMEQCGFHRFEPGGVVLREGESGNSFFVVCSGKMKVSKHNGDQELVMAFLTEGAFFGEMALLSGARRAATVTAEEDAELLEITGPALNQLARRYPQVAQSLRSFGRQRLLANVMATSSLFRPFDKAERKKLVEMFKVREVKPDEVVLPEGQPSDGLYLVMSGELEVRKAVEGGAPLVLATLTDGDVFGEMSLLSHKPAAASVVARRRTTVLRLPRDRFQELIVTYPQALMLVSDLAEGRSKANSQRMATVLSSDSAAPLV